MAKYDVASVLVHDLRLSVPSANPVGVANDIDREDVRQPVGTIDPAGRACDLRAYGAPRQGRAVRPVRAPVLDH